MKRHFLIFKKLTSDFYLNVEKFFSYEIVFLKEENRLEAEKEAEIHFQKMKEENLEILKTLPRVLKKDKYEEVLGAIDFNRIVTVMIPLG